MKFRIIVIMCVFVLAICMPGIIKAAVTETCIASGGDDCISEGILFSKRYNLENTFYDSKTYPQTRVKSINQFFTSEVGYESNEIPNVPSYYGSYVYRPVQVGDVLAGSAEEIRFSALGPYEVWNVLLDGSRYYASGYYAGETTGIAYKEVSSVQNEAQPVLRSKNPAIVECSGSTCVAKSVGTTTIAVSFYNQNFNVPYPNLYFDTDLYFGTVNGDPSEQQYRARFGNYYNTIPNGIGDGYVNIIEKWAGYKKKNNYYLDFENPFYETDQYSVTYRYRDIYIAVDVQESATNTPHIVNFDNAQNITASSTDILWTYQDTDGDVQTNYHVQVATNSTFSNIIQAKVSPGGDVSLIRSVNFDNLVPDTQYYVRVRAYNDLNLWSTWSSGTFTTLSGSCDDSHFDGETVCINEQEHAYYCAADGTWQTTLTGNVCGTASCSATPVVLGESTTFIANPSGAIYQWKSLSDSIILGETGRNYSIQYSQTGSYGIKVDVTQGSITETATCYATVGCDNSHFDGETTQCDSVTNTQEAYYCGLNGWETNTVTCGSNFSLDTFEFNPGIVSPGSMCELVLEVENVTSCTLVSNSGNSININAVGGIISRNRDRIIPVGTHRLDCIDLQGVNHQDLGTKRCISNPEIGEY